MPGVKPSRGPKEPSFVCHPPTPKIDMWGSPKGFLVGTLTSKDATHSLLDDLKDGSLN